MAEALFGTARLPFSVSLEFSPFEGDDYARAMEIARGAVELRDFRSGTGVRHRVRFFSEHTQRLRDLWEIVGRFDSTDVLIDDKPMPDARELWLPLMWILIK